jgi:hypothetical protein
MRNRGARIVVACRHALIAGPVKMFVPIAPEPRIQSLATLASETVLGHLVGRGILMTRD